MTSESVEKRQGSRIIKKRPWDAKKKQSRLWGLKWAEWMEKQVSDSLHRRREDGKVATGDFFYPPNISISVVTQRCLPWTAVCQRERNIHFTELSLAWLTALVLFLCWNRGPTPGEQPRRRHLCVNSNMRHAIQKRFHEYMKQTLDFHLLCLHWALR